LPVILDYREMCVLSIGALGAMGGVGGATWAFFPPAAGRLSHPPALGRSWGDTPKPPAEECLCTPTGGARIAGAYSGTFPCFLRGVVSVLCCSISSARMICQRVSRGSITSSMYPRSAAM
jgi:membrane associated rhomboid family serine protease